MNIYDYVIKTVDGLYHKTSVDPCESSEEGLEMLLSLKWIPTDDYRHINIDNIIYVREASPDKDEK